MQKISLTDLGLEEKDFLYTIDSTIKPSKAEIARQQIEGAIRAFVAGHNPIVIQTLTAPASQILRDLNEGRPASIGTIFSELAVEAGYPVGELWKEFNNSSANYLKHANRLDDAPPYEKIAENPLGTIFFCIHEYTVHCGGISSLMKLFGETWLGLAWLPELSRRALCATQILTLDIKRQIGAAWMRFLLDMLQWVRKSRSPTPS